MEVSDARDEIVHQHQRLFVECDALKPLLKGDIGSDLPRWVALCREHFHRLHVFLREHMYREESGGFMKAVLDHRPTLTNQVRRLKQEHSDLRKECERIEGKLLHEELVNRNTAFKLIGRIESLIDRIHEHEQAENNLLQDAFFEDIGTKD